jgi:hypothetical protein
MDKGGLERNDGCNGKRLDLFEERKNVLAHTIIIIFKTLEWQNKVEEDRPTTCFNG